MLVFIIDDEPKPLKAAVRVVRQALGGCTDIRPFKHSSELLAAIDNDNLRPDVIFCDIEMPGMNGIQLANEVRGRWADTRIIFVTGYSQYAVDAYKMHADGYVLKPLEAERVKEETDRLALGRKVKQDKLKVKCFGRFEVFADDKPLLFKREKTKELLAYLVDAHGDVCTAGEIVTALWEDGQDTESCKSYLRTLISDLKTTLDNAGFGDILLRHRNMAALATDRIDCDYYRYLDGEEALESLYSGEYMKQYSWAEMTKGMLE